MILLLQITNPKEAQVKKYFIFIVLLMELINSFGQQYSYDRLNRLVRVELPNGTTIGYAYDAAGNRTSQTIAVPNKVPNAYAIGVQSARLGSLVTLDGAGSSDPDNGPSPLAYTWLQSSGPTVILSNMAVAKPIFTPTVPGTYAFSLKVSDGAATSAAATVTIKVPQLGDINLDGVVDSNDLNLILAALNKPANGPNDLRDLNGDAKIDALDSRKLITLCTKPRCAVQ